MRSNLVSLCEISIDSKWNLAYRATEHGFGFDEFHSKCAETYIDVLKTYIDGAWNKEHTWFRDVNAYMFSLINKDNNPFKMKCSVPENAAIGACDIAIQVYGSRIYDGSGGHDLLLFADSNVNALSYSNLGSIYKHPDYALGSTQAREFLAGSYIFQTLEIEIFCEQTLN